MVGLLEREFESGGPSLGGVTCSWKSRVAASRGVPVQVGFQGYGAYADDFFDSGQLLLMR